MKIHVYEPYTYNHLLYSVFFYILYLYLSFYSVISKLLTESPALDVQWVWTVGLIIK